MYKNYYFLGIGGIGMSALARYFKAKGCEVAGYDRVKTPLTKELEAEGIDIHYSPLNLPNENLRPDNTLVVYTPAVPEDFEEFVYFKNNDFQIMKRAQVLGEITRTSKGICIAGTHGKTTTSTMTAHLIFQSHVGCSAFLGGVSKNYDTNLLINSSVGEHEEDFVVIEADEYDRSFHRLLPYMALITTIDADHLDIYNDKNDFKKSFEQFASLVQENGYLIVKDGIEMKLNLYENVTKYTYGMESGDFRAANIKIENEQITFDFITPTENIPHILLGVPVLINIENSVGAMALAYLAGVKPDELRKGMATYAGIRRRFDIQVKTAGIVYLDDYAHHPEELKASIISIKTLYPGRKVCGIFQPHLYSRTKDFQYEFAESLSLLDELILLDIYPAREKPIEGVTSDIIFDKVTIQNKTKATKDNLLTILRNKKLEGVLVTFGAGDIDTCVPGIKEMLISSQEGIVK